MNLRRVACLSFALLLPACSGAMMGHPIGAPAGAMAVGAPPPSRPHTVVVSPLLRDGGNDEDRWFGRYSYVLYKTMPRSAGRDHALFAELLSHPSGASVDGGAPYNLTSVPQVAEPWSPIEEHSPDWWIDHYDLGYAADLLVTQQITGPGPFIVSSSGRLSSAQSKQSVDILDLSGATSDESATAWVRYFVSVSEKPDGWASNTSKLVMLHVHDTMVSVGVVIDVLPNKDKLLKAVGL